MRSTLIALAAAATALLPAMAQAQPGPSYDRGRHAPADHGDVTCQAIGCTDWGRPPPPQPRECCGPPPYRDDEARPWPAYDGRGYRQGYYRDYYPAPQYGYTYGSARGRGYGYSYGDYAAPPPYPGGW